jgi:FkbM family methyltransferase
VKMATGDGSSGARGNGVIWLIKTRIISPLIHLARFLRYASLRLINASRQSVRTRHGTIVYATPNARTVMRTVSLYTKEPETIAWIDAFDDGDTLWDVGANTGTYNIYAAANPRRTVLAFEPAAASYAILCRCIELNAMDDRIFAYCLALDDKKQLSTLNMRNTRAGFSGSAFGLTRAHADAEFKPAFRQAAIGYTIDLFIEEFGAPFPNHLKIDVDGNDHLILAGRDRTLTDPRLKSVLVELIGGERCARGTQLLLDAGFKPDIQSESARTNRIFRR